MAPFLYLNMQTCLSCGLETSNPKFCSSSCAAKYNNSISPKRTKTKSCKNCSTLIYSKNTYCKDCLRILGIPHRGSDLLASKTIQEVTLNGSQFANAYRAIRNHSRKVLEKSSQEKKCFNCGYSTYVECCHKIVRLLMTKTR